MRCGSSPTTSWTIFESGRVSSLRTSRNPSHCVLSRICSAYLKRIVRNSSIGSPAERTAADSVTRTRLWLRLRSNTSTTFSRHTSRTVERSQGTTY